MLNKILIGALMMCASPAFAGLILDFDDAPTGPHVYRTFTESGYTIDGFSYDTPGEIHLDDTVGAYYQNDAIISGSKRFNALSLHIQGHPFDSWYEIHGPYDEEYFTYPNVLVQGIRDNSIVAEARFTAEVGDKNYFLSPEFTGLDRLMIVAARTKDPGLASYFDAIEANLESLYPGVGYTIRCGGPCSHFNLDSVTVSPVPVPGALVLMLSAVMGGGITRRLMKKKTA
jgi:hypothetical protein